MNDTTKNYQATFILDTRACSDVDALIERIGNTIRTVDNATITQVTPIGQKPFSRVKHKQFPAGVYVTFDVVARPKFPSLLNQRFSLDKSVNRILITVE